MHISKVYMEIATERDVHQSQP